MKTTFSFINQYQHQTNLDTIADLFVKLHEKRYDAATLGLTLSNDRKRQYSIVEYAWLQVLQELKAFGFSLKAMQQLRKNLVEPLPGNMVVEGFDEFSSRPEEHDALEQQLFASIDKETHASLNQTKQFLLHPDMPLFITMLGLVVTEYVMRGTDTYLLIQPTGDFFVWQDEKAAVYNKHDLYDIKNEHHISISISKMMKKLIPMEQAAKPSPQLRLINKNEEEVLRYIREKELSSLTLRFAGKSKISLIEATENLNTVDVGARYSDHILKNGYQDISISTKQGRIVKFQRITKQKLNN